MFEERAAVAVADLASSCALQTSPLPLSSSHGCRGPLPGPLSPSGDSLGRGIGAHGGQDHHDPIVDLFLWGFLGHSVLLLESALPSDFSSISAAMSDDGDRTCPLCAEEMDITDQQLKPCKCGYDICVWCWHHIIDMAEKEETEGRCPACRTRYDKDRIVKMAATCERTVAEKNTERKHKTQKVKPKAASAASATTTTSTVEAKKHLASVRVIQRNLVYIIGLPAHLCNESVLERREYFGQYGKVLKVSVSRPTGPPSQQASANNNISVYNATNQTRLSPPNSSSGRSTLPPAASWGHRDLNARTTAPGVTLSDSHTKTKPEPQSNSFSSSSTTSSTRIPSSWNDDTNTAPTMSGGWQVSEQDSASKTLQPYKPGIAKEAQAVSSLESSLDIDFSTIPSAWNDDDIVVSDGMSKGSEDQVGNENVNLTHPVSESPISPKKDMTVNMASVSPSDFGSNAAIPKSDANASDGDCPITKITPKGPTSNDVSCQSSHAVREKILEDIGPQDTGMEKLSVEMSSVTLDGKHEDHSMVGNNQPDAMPCTPVVVVPMDQIVDKDQSHLNLDGLLPSENKDTVLSCRYVFFSGTSWSKISAPPGFSSATRVPPPGFSSGFPSQDGINPPPGFSGGISSHDGSILPPRFHSGVLSQEMSKPPPRLPSPFSSGFSSQVGANSPSRFPSSFSSGFSSQVGSNQVYSSKHSETLIQDNVLGSNRNHYRTSFGRHTSDIEFNDPAILAVGKGRMPGIGDSGLEMNNAPAFPSQLQTSNNELRFQLGMQPNVQSHQNMRFTDHMQDAFNPVSDNHLASRFLSQNHGLVSPYTQRPQQPGNSQIINGQWDGRSDLRQGSNNPLPDMSRTLYPSELNNLHMLGSNDIFNRAFGM
nr:unnamed protein product [Digitaria exilis]